MSYITGPGEGSHDSWMVWTNEANFNTEMNPANFEYVNFEHALGRTESSASPSGNVATIGPRKILDAGLSARQGLPVYVTLHSGARRNTVPTGYVFGRLRYLRENKSSGSSSEQNGTHVGPGGTSSGNRKYKPDSYGNFRYERGFVRGARGPCDPGYLLDKKANGRWACVRVTKHSYVK